MRRTVLIVVAALAVATSPASAVEAPWVTSLPIKHLQRNFVAAFPDGTAYVFQQQWGGEGLQLFKSSDFGVTWRVLPQLPENGLVMVAFSSPENGMLHLNNHLYVTTDGAATWRDIGRPWTGAAVVDFVEAAADARTFVVGVREWKESDGDVWYDDGNDERECHDPRQDRLEVVTTSDLGRTWRRHVVYRGAPVLGHGADFFDARHGIVTVSDDADYRPTGGECGYRADVPSGRRVLMTSSRGKTFDEIYECGPDDSCLAVAMGGPRHAVIGSTDGDVAVTFDGGASFVESRLDGLAELPTIRDDYRWVYDFDFASPLVGFASTNGRGLWRTVDGGRTWAREPSPLDAPGWQYPGAGRIAAADESHAIAVAPPMVVTRVP